MITGRYVSEISLKREAVPSFEQYPFSLAAVRPLETLELHSAVTFFIGESPSRQLSIITRIHDLVQQRSQFIIATHSPILMAYPNAFIYSFSEQGIERMAYKDTEHYRITRDFLANPERMLRLLMAP